MGTCNWQLAEQGAEGEEQRELQRDEQREVQRDEQRRRCRRTARLLDAVFGYAKFQI